MPRITNRHFVILTVCQVSFSKREKFAWQFTGVSLILYKFIKIQYFFCPKYQLHYSLMNLNCVQIEHFYITIPSLRERTERKYRFCGFIHSLVFSLEGRT